MSKKKYLLIAIGLGVVAFFLNQSYISSQIDAIKPKKFVTVTKVKKAIKAGGTVTEALVEAVKVPEEFVPKLAIAWKDASTYFGQEVGMDVDAGDYLLDNVFPTRAVVGYKLSEQIEGAGNRAVTIPVDETNSLSRSLLTGDRIDIFYSFQVPGVSQKLTALLLQNVFVVATGSYSAADQEVSAKAGGKRYTTITLLLSARDAARLLSARQTGQISVVLRNAKDNTPAEVPVIAGVKDILSPNDRALVDAAMKAVGPNNEATEKLREQLQSVIDAQRNQGRK